MRCIPLVYNIQATPFLTSQLARQWRAGDAYLCQGPGPCGNVWQSTTVYSLCDLHPHVKALDAPNPLEFSGTSEQGTLWDQRFIVPRIEVVPIRGQTKVLAWD